MAPNWEPGGSDTAVLVPKWPHAWPPAHPEDILKRRGKPYVLRSRRKKAIVTQEESRINRTIKGRFVHIYSTHPFNPDGPNALCIFIPHPQFKSQHPPNHEAQPKQVLTHHFVTSTIIHRGPHRLYCLQHIIFHMLDAYRNTN